jgi:hypothetical protein
LNSILKFFYSICKKEHEKIIVVPLLLISAAAFTQSADEASIRNVLDQQVIAWNNGNIEKFMQGYWNNDSLMFIGKSGINRGWQNTLLNYKRSYPDTTAMGKLSFDIIIVKKLSNEYYYVVGKWMLKRSIGDAAGYYNLLFKKINGQWLIIADHSS